MTSNVGADDMKSTLEYSAFVVGWKEKVAGQGLH